MGGHIATMGGHIAPMGGHIAHRSHDALLLFLQVLVELRPRPVVPYQIWVLRVGVKDFQHLLDSVMVNKARSGEEDHTPLQGLFW